MLLKKTPQRAFSWVSAMWVHSKKIAVHEPRSEFSPDSNLPVSWSWLPSLQNHEKLILAVYTPQSIWYCIYSTLNGLRQLSIILSEEFRNLLAHPLQNLGKKLWNYQHSLLKNYLHIPYNSWLFIKSVALLIIIIQD